MNKNKESFYAIDLFAGCGGLSEGFKQAGFDIIAQVEMDKWACDTLRTRHLYHELKDIGKGYLYRRYLREKGDKDKILNEYPAIKEAILRRVIHATFGKDKTDMILNKVEYSKNFHGASEFHVLLGGPPCQPYSFAGRARDPQRMRNDERHYLYRYYLEILENLKPDIFVYENVPGLFTARAGREQIFLKILEDFSSLDPPYEITPPLEHIAKDPRSYIMNSADFGIPQRRKRLFLIGYKKFLDRKNPRIKRIFSTLQRQALKNKKDGYANVKDALGDLPALSPGDGSDGWFCPYNGNCDLKVYQKKMRRNSPGIVHHRARTHMKSDIERYRFFIEHHENGNNAATLKDLMGSRPDLIPNHKHLDKFLDRFKVQWWDRPSSTITAHICKDGHYYIHLNINQCRSFTVRVVMAIMGFNEDFIFPAGIRMGVQYQMVADALSPDFLKYFNVPNNHYIGGEIC